MTTQPCKTRFCPSPTGHIHCGNLRTALFNWLLANRQPDGVFLLRIEDTDQTRSLTEHVDQLFEDLRWLGLLWNEGPNAERDQGPYYQSQRQAIYDQYYDQLIAQDQAYPCFCTEEDLALQRRVQRSQGRPPRYSGRCRGLSASEVAAKQADGVKSTLRFKIPLHQSIVFDDLVKGRQRFLSDDLGDFIIRRTDGTAPFLFCNAIDDALMGVTHALRGDDHLTNTPRQLMVLEALGLNAPQYGHISLIVGPDGAPLSKRHGSRSIAALREAGYLPGAILNYLARLGHYYGDDEYKTLIELARQFDMTSLSRSPAQYQQTQLEAWQKRAVDALNESEFFAWLSTAGKDISDRIGDVWLQGNVSLTQGEEGLPQRDALTQCRQDLYEALHANVVFPNDISHWLAVLRDPELVYDEAANAVLAETPAAYFQVARAAYEQHQDYAAVIQTLKTELKLKGKALFMPLRVVLTARDHGPELAKLLPLMDPSVVVSRLKARLNQ